MYYSYQMTTSLHIVHYVAFSIMPVIIHPDFTSFLQLKHLRLMRRLFSIKTLCMNTVTLSGAMQMTYLKLFNFFCCSSEKIDLWLFLSISIYEFCISLPLVNNHYQTGPTVYQTIKIHYHGSKSIPKDEKVKYCKACYFSNLEKLRRQENSTLLNLKRSFPWGIPFILSSQKSLAMKNESTNAFCYFQILITFLIGIHIKCNLIQLLIQLGLLCFHPSSFYKIIRDIQKPRRVQIFYKFNITD